MPKDELSAAPEVHRLPGRTSQVLTSPIDILRHIPDLSPDRVKSGNVVAERFAFRLPEYYARQVLNGLPDDPLLDLVFPSVDEMNDSEELWDATPSPYRASDSPFWIQKYEFQGLIRTTSVCSGLCRFCYLKRKNQEPTVMRVEDVDRLFDDLEQRGRKLREIILSGGDPLCAPADVIERIAARMARIRTRVGFQSPHITIHTREPVWDPEKLLRKKALLSALGRLRPKTYMINILHPREVTPEFEAACRELSDVAGREAKPAFFCQHPLFRGVNDSVEILEELYQRLIACSPPIIPYYLVHPFYNGTLAKHKLSLLESQRIYMELVRRPGCITPRLVVPTPHGKCIVGPFEKLVEEAGAFRITTKDGKSVLLP